MNKSGRMINNYFISRWTRKWTKKLFFHLTDLNTKQLHTTAILHAKVPLVEFSGRQEWSPGTLSRVAHFEESNAALAYSFYQFNELHSLLCPE